VRRERGQASVELALCLPVVAVLLLLVVQSGLVVADQVAVTQAAREGARRASVDPDPEAARRAALGGRLAASRTAVVVDRVAGDPELVRVTVRHRGVTDVPIVGRLLPDIDLEATAAMAVEGG
jgi:Flp pilus assembly protein TadG